MICKRKTHYEHVKTNLGIDSISSGSLLKPWESKKGLLESTTVQLTFASKAFFFFKGKGFFFCCCCFLFNWRQGSLFIPGWPGTCYIDQGSLLKKIHLPLPPGCVGVCVCA